MPSIFSRPFKNEPSTRTSLAVTVCKGFSIGWLYPRAHMDPRCFRGRVCELTPPNILNALRGVCTPRSICGPLRWFSVYANTFGRTLEGKYSTWYHAVLWRYSLITARLRLFSMYLQGISQVPNALTIHWKIIYSIKENVFGLKRDRDTDGSKWKFWFWFWFWQNYIRCLIHVIEFMFALKKNPREKGFIRESHTLFIVLRLASSFRRSYVEEDIRKSGSTERHTWPPIIPASHPTAPSSSFAAFPPSLTPGSRTLGGPPQSKTPKDNSDIIPPIPKQSGWTRKIDPCRRTTCRVAPETRVPTDVYQIINRRLTDPEQPGWRKTRSQKIVRIESKKKFLVNNSICEHQ